MRWTCAAPFRLPDGKKSDSLSVIRKAVDHPPPDGIVMKTYDPIELAKLNEARKKMGHKELNQDEIKEYESYLGKDGRILFITPTKNGNVIIANNPMHVLVRIKDGKAQIVGLCTR